MNNDVVNHGRRTDVSPAVEVLTSDETGSTIIAFGGYAHQLMMPPTEFARTLSSFPISIILVKDLQRAWYQRGISGLGDSPASAACALAGLVPDGTHLLGTVGTSMGGTGAILYGHLMSVPRVVAFSPRTLITADLIHRLRKQGLEVPYVDTARPSCNLAHQLQAPARPRIDVHVGGMNNSDVTEAQRISRFAEVSIFRHPTDSHAVAAWLRDEGLLSGILASAFGLTAH